MIEAIHQSKFKDCFSYDICGEGTLKEELTQLIKQYGLENQVRLLGYRDDVHRLLAESDIFVFPSFREGLPVSVMEAMATGLPVEIMIWLFMKRAVFFLKAEMLKT